MKCPYHSSCAVVHFAPVLVIHEAELEHGIILCSGISCALKACKASCSVVSLSILGSFAVVVLDEVSDFSIGIGSLLEFAVKFFGAHLASLDCIEGDEGILTVVDGIFAMHLFEAVLLFTWIPYWPLEKVFLEELLGQGA